VVSTASRFSLNSPTISDPDSSSSFSRARFFGFSFLDVAFYVLHSPCPFGSAYGSLIEQVTGLSLGSFGTSLLELFIQVHEFSSRVHTGIV